MEKGEKMVAPDVDPETASEFKLTISVSLSDLPIRSSRSESSASAAAAVVFDAMVFVLDLWG